MENTENLSKMKIMGYMAEHLEKEAREQAKHDAAAKVILSRTFKKVAQDDRLLAEIATDQKRHAYFTTASPVKTAMDILRNIYDFHRYGIYSRDISTREIKSHEEFPAFVSTLEKKGLRVADVEADRLTLSNSVDRVIKNCMVITLEPTETAQKPALKP